MPVLVLRCLQRTSHTHTGFIASLMLLTSSRPIPTCSFLTLKTVLSVWDVITRQVRVPLVHLIRRQYVGARLLSYLFNWNIFTSSIRMSFSIGAHAAVDLASLSAVSMSSGHSLRGKVRRRRSSCCPIFMFDHKHVGFCPLVLKRPLLQAYPHLWPCCETRVLHIVSLVGHRTLWCLSPVSPNSQVAKSPAPTGCPCCTGSAQTLCLSPVPAGPQHCNPYLDLTGLGPLPSFVGRWRQADTLLQGSPANKAMTFPVFTTLTKYSSSHGDTTHLALPTTSQHPRAPRPAACVCAKNLGLVQERDVAFCPCYPSSASSGSMAVFKDKYNKGGRAS